MRFQLSKSLVLLAATATTTALLWSGAASSAQAQQADGVAVILENQLAAAAPAEAKDKDYRFLLTCNNPTVRQELAVRGAASTTVQVPAGAECYLSWALQQADAHGFVKNLALQGERFTAGTAPHRVTATSTYQRFTGGFTVTSEIVDEANLAPNKKVEFNYACTHQELQLTGAEASGSFVLGNGKSQRVTGIPGGSNCSLQAAAPQVAGANLTAAGFSKPFVVVNNETVAVKAVHTYTPKADTPDDNNAPGGEQPGNNTGDNNPGSDNTGNSGNGANTAGENTGNSNGAGNTNAGNTNANSSSAAQQSSGTAQQSVKKPQSAPQLAVTGAAPLGLALGAVAATVFGAALLRRRS